MTYSVTLSVEDVAAERAAAQPASRAMAKARTKAPPPPAPDIYEVQAEALRRLRTLLDADGIQHEAAELRTSMISVGQRVTSVRASLPPRPESPAYFIGGPLDGTTAPCPYFPAVYRRPDGVAYEYSETVWAPEGATHVFQYVDPEAEPFTWHRP